MHLLALWPWLLTFQPQNHTISRISQGHSLLIPSLNALDRQKNWLWFVSEQHKLWINTRGCHQAKELMQQVVPRLFTICLTAISSRSYETKLSLDWLMVIITPISIWPWCRGLCPLCIEDDETSLHFLGRCNQYLELLSWSPRISDRCTGLLSWGLLKPVTDFNTV